LQATPFQIHRDFGKGMLAVHKAAAEGDLTELRWLVRSGADCAEADRKGWMPIHYACREGHLEVLDHVANLIMLIRIVGID
jgi:ankyrin repeat protein